MAEGLTVLLLGMLGIGPEQAKADVMPRIQTAPLSLASQPVQRGEAGPRVNKLHEELRLLGYLPISGSPQYFGMATDAGVRNFQADWGLNPDGMVGPTTQAALDEALKKLRAPRTAQKVLSYTVRPGDSILRISQALLGDPKRWPEILAFNHLKDPRLVVPGMVLKIPARQA